MSKEAKIGLLLGLVFIIAIAIVLKGVHQNSNSDPGDLLAQNGQVKNQTAPGADHVEGLDMQDAVRRFNENPEPPTPEKPNTEKPNLNVPAQDKTGPALDNVIDSNQTNQKDTVNQVPAITTGGWPYPNTEPRAIRDLPGAESTTPSRPVDNVIATIGKPESRHEEWSYVVKKDDKLWNIAQNELGSGARWQEISLLNNLANPDTLKIGQTLRMPSRQQRTPSSSDAIQSSGPATPGGSGEYIIRKGDSLWSIAQNELGNGARWPEIQRLNNLPAENVLPGQKIRLPDRQNITIASSNSTSPQGGLYEVKDKESLWVIAQRELGDGTRWPEIQQLNNLPNEQVQKGQKIKLPHR